MAECAARLPPRLDRMSRHCLTFVCVALLVPGALAAEPPAGSAEDLAFFETRIRPVLVERCYRCHSQTAAEKNQLKGGLRLDTRDGLLRGGDSGPAVVPGKANESLLLESLRYESFEMPPDGRLADDVIADFATWIARGAADPREGDAAVVRSAIDLEVGRRHWAYQPLPVPPRRSPADVDAAEGDSPPLSPIDAFINVRLQAASLAPLSAADRTTLARRLSFDLTGMPPSPEQVDAFIHDPEENAYERLVDRLLASPHFGERWGRHWLDIARFAESVTLRGLVQQQAWRYRDYVIDAFNNDLPYDQFLCEQIAGDLLPAVTLADARRQHIATGFLTFTDANLEDQDKEKLRMDVVDEQLTVIGQALLGQTIGCARCHDHKFDPIPTTDYYALAGILRNTKTMEHANVSRWIERPLPLPPEQEQLLAAHEAQVAELQQQLADLKKQLGKRPNSVAQKSLRGVVVDDVQATFVGAWTSSAYSGPFVEKGYQHDGNTARGEKSATFRAMLPQSGRYEVRLSYTPGGNRSTHVEATIRTVAGEQTVVINEQQPPPIDGLFMSLGEHAFTADQPAEVIVTNDRADGHVVVDAVQWLSQNDLATTNLADQQPSESSDVASTKTRQARLKRLEADLKQLKASAPPRLMYQGVQEEATIANAHVNIRGNVHNLGDEVPRGFLQVVSAGTRVLPTDESGRRELGEWLADPTNPLPARVYANRVWHWLFGAGLVRTVDNLGTTGELPSHPQLLDYLAGRFIEQGWSTKALVREIVLSQAYRRQSAPSAKQEAADPENRLLWRMNRKRLDAECLLDAVLSVSGELDPQVGGKMLPDDLSADYGYPQGSPRRAIYWPQLRNALPELLQAFDGANPSLVSGRRNVSSVAPQALYLMNNPWIAQQSRRAAKRLLDEGGPSDSARIQAAFRLTLGRLPTDGEEQTVTAFLAGSDQLSAEERLTRWAELVQSLMSSLDFRYLQ